MAAVVHSLWTLSLIVSLCRAAVYEEATGYSTCTYSAWFSEEQAASPPGNYNPINYYAASGSYSDNQQVLTCTTFSRSYNSRVIRAATTGVWSGYFSEEGSGSATCASGRIVNQIQCQEDHCDNMRILCSLPVDDSWTTRTSLVGDCWWSPVFSDPSYAYTSATCPLGMVMTGLNCYSGGDCDNLRIYCCKLMIKVNPCAASPCQNGGTCQVTGDTTFSCQCTPAWQGTTCQTDVNECLRLPYPCSARQPCSNQIGAYACGTYLYAGSLSGYSAGNSLSTAGGQRLTFRALYPYAFYVDTPGVFYGPVGDPLRYPCDDFSYVYVSSLVYDFSCTTRPGVGERMVLTVRSCTWDNGCIYLSPMDFGTAADVFAYPRPTITGGSLYFTAGDPVGHTQIYSNNNLGDSVSFQGSNFLADPNNVSPARANGIFRVTFGPAGAPNRFVCNVDYAKTTRFLLTCVTQPGASGTVALRFTVHADKYNVTGFDSLSYPPIPTLSSITGCDVPAWPGTAGCPTEGGIILTIQGSDFIPPLGVFINGNTCPVLTSNVTNITCQLPAGVGTDSTVFISSREQFSSPLNLLSYAAPAVTHIVGCDAVNGSALEIVRCARAGGERLTIYGRNFGRKGATVLVGSAQCTGVVHVPDAEHTTLTCALPPGYQLDRTVYVSQRGGDVSPTAVLLSYVPCAEGTYQNNDLTACANCSQGRYADGVGLFQCKLCEPGRFQALETQSTCDDCVAGTFQSGVGASACEQCGVGQSSAGHANRCVGCAADTASPVMGSAQCNPCGGESAVGDVLFASADHTFCMCTAGYYTAFDYGIQVTVTHTDGSNGLVNAPGINVLCSGCPQGGHCPHAGTTVATIQTQPGWWRSDNASLAFQQCLLRAHCVGTSDDNLDPNAPPGSGYSNIAMQCPPHRVGPLCAVCEDGYNPTFTQQECAACPSRSSAVVISVFVLAIFLAILLGLYYVILPQPPSREEMEYHNALLVAQGAGAYAGAGAGVGTGGSGPPSPLSSSEHSHNSTDSNGSGSASSGYESAQMAKIAAVRTVRAVQKQKAIAIYGGLPEWELLWTLGYATPDDPEVADSPDAPHYLELSAGSVLSEESRLLPADRKPTFSLKIVIGFLQISSALVTIAEIPWPSAFASFASSFSFISLDFIPWGSLQCLEYKFDYYTKFLVVTLMPLAVTVLLSLCYLLPLWIIDRRDMADDDYNRNRRKDYRRKFVRLFLFTLFLIYPGVSAKVLGFFYCREVNGHYYLVNDFRLECGDDRWMSYLGWAAISVIIYPLGVPTLLGTLLLRYRRRLHHPDVRLAMGFLYEAYTARNYWFELVDMVEKLALTALLGFLPLGGRMSFGMAIVGLHLIITLCRVPYVRKSDDRFALYAQVLLLLVLTAGHVLYTVGDISPGSAMDVVLSVILIVATLCLFLALLLNAIKFIRTRVRARQNRKMRENAAKDQIAEVAEDDTVAEVMTSNASARNSTNLSRKPTAVRMVAAAAVDNLDDTDNEPTSGDGPKRVSTKSALSALPRGSSTSSIAGLKRQPSKTGDDTRPAGSVGRPAVRLQPIVLTRDQASHV